MRRGFRVLPMFLEGGEPGVMGVTDPVDFRDFIFFGLSLKLRALDNERRLLLADYVIR
jgi:hypothetical protein